MYTVLFISTPKHFGRPVLREFVTDQKVPGLLLNESASGFSLRGTPAINIARAEAPQASKNPLLDDSGSLAAILALNFGYIVASSLTDERRAPSRYRGMGLFKSHFRAFWHGS